MELHMLDTNMVSYIIKGRSPMARARLLERRENEAAVISTVTEAEIRYGLAKRPEATALRSLMDGFLASIRVLAWGREEAEVYGSLRARLERDGISLGNLDLMIAAHALAAGAVLVTNDQAFSRVDGLVVTNWACEV